MVPVHMQQTYRQIADLLETGCKSLYPAYCEVCLEALEELCCIRPSPVQRGSPALWAGSLLHAVGHTNLLWDQLSPTHRSSAQLLAAIRVKSGSAASKSRRIRKLLQMNRGSMRWMRPALEEGNPRVWWISLKGGPEIDVRTKPIAVQQMAVKLGLIPIAPALLKNQKGANAGEPAGKTTQP